MCIRDRVYAFDPFILPPFNYKYALAGLSDNLDGFDEEFLQAPIAALKKESKHIIDFSDGLFHEIKALNEACLLYTSVSRISGKSYARA